MGVMLKRHRKDRLWTGGYSPVRLSQWQRFSRLGSLTAVPRAGCWGRPTFALHHPPSGWRSPCISGRAAVATRRVHSNERLLKCSQIGSSRCAFWRSVWSVVSLWPLSGLAWRSQNRTSRSRTSHGAAEGNVPKKKQRCTSPWSGNGVNTWSKTKTHSK